MPKAGSNYTCLAVILTNFVLMKDENYYLQVFLKESKYIEKEKYVIRYITDNVETFSDDSEEEYFTFNKNITNFHKRKRFTLCKLF